MLIQLFILPEQTVQQQKTRLICSGGFMIFSFHHTPFSSRLRASMRMMMM
jgi:arginine/ornithine N-succinyltransferase beta subunit